MKIVSVSLGNKGGVFEVVGVANLINKTAKFQVTANGLVYFESEEYDEAREVMIESVRINQNNRENSN